MWLLAAVGLLAVSCMVKEPEQDAMMTDAPKITAMVGTGGAATKVSVTETDGQTRQTFWEKGDEIAVFMHNGRALRYALEGEGGESSGVFSYVSGNGLGLEFPQVYGVYPYAKDVAFDGTALQVNFPAAQAYTENSFDPKANLMVAASRTNDLYFRNVGGYLVLKLWGEDVNVKKIVINGVAGEPLAGPAAVWASESEAPEIEIAEETAEKAITLTCETPVALGATADAGTEFWIVVPPTWFEEGLTVTVYGKDGDMFTRVAKGDDTEDSSLSIARKEVYRLGTEVELGPEEPAMDLTVDMIDKIEVPAAATSVELPYTASKEVTVTARRYGGMWSLRTPKDLTANPLVATFDANESHSDDVGGIEFTFTDADGNSVTRQVTIIHRADIEFAVEATHDHIVFDKETSSVVVTFTGNKDCSISNFNAYGRRPNWMIARRLDNMEANEPIMVVFYPEPNTTSEARTGQFWIRIGTNEDPYEDVATVVTFEQTPGAWAEPPKYTFSVPNTTIKVNNARQFVHVPFISTVAPDYVSVEIVDSPSWIYDDSSYVPMTFVVSANNAEDASERNAQVIYTYTDPKGNEHTGSFHIYQSATKSIE